MGLFGLLSCRLAPSSSWMCPLMSGRSDASLFAPAGSPHSRLDTRHGLLHPLGWAYPVSGRPEPFHRIGILSARKAGIGVFRIAPLGSCEMVTTFRMGPHGSVLGCLPTRMLYPGARRPTVAGYKPGYFTMRPMVHDMTNRTAHPPNHRGPHSSPSVHVPYWHPSAHGSDSIRESDGIRVLAGMRYWLPIPCDTFVCRAVLSRAPL